MEDNSTYTIYCSRCGSEMKNNSRYCMKCGNLNMDHPDNKGMVKYVKDNKGDYSYSSGEKFINNEVNNGDLKLVSLRKSLKSCFIFNTILYLVSILLTFFIYYNYLGNIEAVFNSSIAYCVIAVSISFIYMFAYELLFIKLGFSWWESLVPIYNVILLSKRVFDNDYIGLLILVPFVGQIFSLILIYKMGVKFGKSGILTLLFPVIMILIISFGEALFDDTKIVSDDDYAYFFKIKKYFLILCFIFIFGSVSLIILNKSVSDVVISYFKDRYHEVKKILSF